MPRADLSQLFPRTAGNSTQPIQRGLYHPLLQRRSRWWHHLNLNRTFLSNKITTYNVRDLYTKKDLLRFNISPFFLLPKRFLTLGSII